jgi:hypothetical protein
MPSARAWTIASAAGLGVCAIGLGTTRVSNAELVAAAWTGAGVFVHALVTPAWTVGNEAQFAYLSMTMTCWCGGAQAILWALGRREGLRALRLSIVAGNLFTSPLRDEVIRLTGDTPTTRPS